MLRVNNRKPSGNRRKPTNRKKFKRSKTKPRKDEMKAAIALLMKMSKEQKRQLGWYDNKPKLGEKKWTQPLQSA